MKKFSNRITYPSLLCIVFLAIGLLFPISAHAADAWTGAPSPFTVEQDLAHLLQELLQQAESILEKIRLGKPVGSSEAQALLSHQDAINADLLLLESRLSENEQRLIEKGHRPLSLTGSERWTGNLLKKERPLLNYWIGFLYG